MQTVRGVGWAIGTHSTVFVSWLKPTAPLRRGVYDWTTRIAALRTYALGGLLFIGLAAYVFVSGAWSSVSSGLTAVIASGERISAAPAELSSPGHLIGDNRLTCGRVDGCQEVTVVVATEAAVSPATPPSVTRSAVSSVMQGDTLATPVPVAAPLDAVTETPVAIPSIPPTASAVSTSRVAESAPAEAPTASPAVVANIRPSAVATLAATASATSTASTIGEATPTPTAGDQPQVVLDEHFTTNQRGWPNDERSTAWLADGGYRLSVREPGKFVAVGAPTVGRPRDVSLTGTFRKVGGPPGGGYGLVVRDQSEGPLDGVSQDGRFYVLEVGDRGEIGIWRRDGGRWIDLLPWSPAAAVRTGEATNELTVDAIGEFLVFKVNGTEVARQRDATLGEGAVGVFVGGDGNQALLERLVVKAVE